jgi:hypothetical protein
LLRKINDPRYYSATRQYGLAKLGSTALAIELAQRHPGWRVSSAHPGLVESWDRTAALDALRARLPTAWLRDGMDRARAQVLWSPEQGALTQVLLAMGAVEHASGAYLHPVAHVVAPPVTAQDPAFRAALWQMLEGALSRGGSAAALST